MADLPIDRDTSDTGHLADHNTLHALHNLIDGDGSNGQVLTRVAGAPAWAAPSGTSVVPAVVNNRTAGNLTLNGTVWADLPTIGTSWDSTLAAVAGDILELSLSAAMDSAATNTFFDAVTIVSGSVTNSVSTGAAPSNSNGGVSVWWMPSGISTKSGGVVLYTVQAGDVSGGNVVVRLRWRGDSAVNRNLHASAVFPLQFTAKNLG